ncbi:MAG: hypothetical protein E7580_01360 [Ruminococcaceae bacterium]|nr:hypothetical protein [Oscillospiraceae bacterium]
MKRIFAGLLALMTLLSLVSCASPSLESAQPQATAEAKTVAEAEKKTEKKEDEVKAGPITLPEGFSVGYARRDITPISWPTLSYNGDYAKSAHDPLQITCVAISDGEKAALIVTVDMRNIGAALIQRTKELLTKNLKGVEIPYENIFINSSHSHSAVDCNYDDPSVIGWKSQVYYKQLPLLSQQALQDLTPAEAYSGKSHTDGITFVRRYIREDGTFTGIHMRDNTNSPIARHETEADNEMRVLRFDREGDKKDVVMVNYQTHYGSASNLYPGQISADFVHTFREAMEEDGKYLFSYCNGASGNLNFQSNIPGERKYENFVKGTPHFVDVAKQAIASEEKMETGPLQIAHSDYTALRRQYSAERIAQAKEVNAAGKDTPEQSELISKYGFQSRYEASAVESASNVESSVVPFTAITFGDVGFVAAPYEMFDTNGQEVRAASPFKMTFVFGYTNGSFSYIPSALAWKNGGYEVYTCVFREGCGEEFAAEMVRLLNVCYTAANG